MSVKDQIDALPLKAGEVLEKNEQIAAVAMQNGKEAYPFNDMVIVKGTGIVKTISFLENTDKLSISYVFELEKLNEYAEAKGLQKGYVVMLDEGAKRPIINKDNPKSAYAWSKHFKEDKRSISDIVRETPTVEVVDFYLVSVNSIVCYFK